MAVQFGAPIKGVKVPDNVGKGGRESNAPALTAFLLQVTEADGTCEMPPVVVDGKPEVGHPVSRVTQLRAVAKDYKGDPPRAWRIETAAEVKGKRYRIFVTAVPVTPAAANGKTEKAAAK